MESHDVQQLAQLARLTLSDDDADAYRQDFSSILGYINSIVEVEIPDGNVQQQVLTNAVREDDNPYERAQYTDAILSVSPATKDGYVKVKKIL
jgi:aspartyl/glutamyl-tRNA(Asn/Gln) amidotransferase C subunit